jgi:PIN domain nuclease of toxin-antitoxin system
MKLLLDTHTFIWWDSEPDKLSESALALCNVSSNALILSVASAWEIQIKHQLGKLTLRMPLSSIIEGQQKRNRLRILPISLQHALALDTLPLYYKDPFDRILIAQAKVEKVAILSADPVFTKYPIRVRW